MLQGLRLFDLEWENIQAGQAWAVKNADWEPRALRLCYDYPNAGAYVLDLRLHPRDRIAWLETGLQSARKQDNKYREGVMLGNLGIAYENLGDYTKAIERYQQELQIAREIGDRRGEGNALGNLGLAYENLGDYTKAIEHYQQALQIDREIGDRRGEGDALGNLGNAYDNLGDYTKAIEYHQQRLQIAARSATGAGRGLRWATWGMPTLTWAITQGD